MNIRVSNQTKLDELEQIGLLEGSIDLSTDNIMEKFHDKLASERKSSIRKRMAYAGVVACIALIMVANWHSLYSMASLLFTDYVITDQDDNIVSEMKMKPISVIKPSTFDEEGRYTATKYYSSWKECEKELGIHLLTSDLAWDHSYDEKIRMVYPFEMNGVTLSDFLYIIGDLKNFKQYGRSASHAIASGDDKYGSPISLNIEFFIKGTKSQIPAVEGDTKSGSSSYVEVYKSKSGKEAKIMGYVGVGSGINRYDAYILDNNILYTLSGNVELMELKRIIDSFH